MTSLQDIAQQYVALVLATGQHDPDYVDAYYGPPEWKAEAEAAPQSLADLQAQAEQLQQRLASLGRDPGPRGDVREAEMLGLRKAYLKKQTGALRTRLAMLSGTRMPFDEESLALYDAAVRERTEEEFRTVLEALSRLLSGAGSVLDR